MIVLKLGPLGCTIINGDIPKNTEVDEKLVQKREEPEKEVSENKF
jgi:hypothetical protein